VRQVFWSRTQQQFLQPLVLISNGNLTGKVTGSFLRPSYDNCHSVVCALYTTSMQTLKDVPQCNEVLQHYPRYVHHPSFLVYLSSKSFCPMFTIASPMAASPCGWYCMVLPITLATLLNRPSSISFMEWAILRCTGFKSIFNTRYSSFQNYIRGVIQKPIFIQAIQ
jgi:hypothetical protein